MQTQAIKPRSLVSQNVIHRIFLLYDIKNFYF